MISLQDGNRYPEVNSGDGSHYNDKGYAIAYRRLVAANLTDLATVAVLYIKQRWNGGAACYPSPSGEPIKGKVEMKSGSRTVISFIQSSCLHPGFAGDGTLRETVHAAAGKSLTPPSRLGTGALRYLWSFPLGSAQGLLIRAP